MDYFGTFISKEMLFHLSSKAMIFEKMEYIIIKVKYKTFVKMNKL